MICTSNWDFE